MPVLRTLSWFNVEKAVDVTALAPFASSLRGRDEAFSRSFDEWLEIASPYPRGAPEFDEYRQKVEQMARDVAEVAPMTTLALFTRLSRPPPSSTH